MDLGMATGIGGGRHRVRLLKALMCCPHARAVSGERIGRRVGCLQLAEASIDRGELRPVLSLPLVEGEGRAAAAPCLGEDLKACG